MEVGLVVLAISLTLQSRKLDWMRIKKPGPKNSHLLTIVTGRDVIIDTKLLLLSQSNN